MSENFPFAGAVEPEGDNRRKMVLVAAVGALLVAVLGYFVVVPALAGGDDAAPVTAVRKAPQKATSKAKKTDAKAKAKKPAAKKPAAAPAQYSDVSARSNPFRALWTEPKASTAGGSAPTGGAAGPAAPAAPGSQPGPGSSTGVGGQRVSLMTVFNNDGVDFAQTKVGDVVYTPKVGQVFAVSFKLLAVSGKTATYLYGDEQFTLSVGQEVLK